VAAHRASGQACVAIQVLVPLQKASLVMKVNQSQEIENPFIVMALAVKTTGKAVTTNLNCDLLNLSKIN
jgi:hypothetical protein